MKRSTILRSLVLTTVAWFAMIYTHESGHILAGWSCGGILVSVELRPWCLPHSYFQPDPNPLLRLWAGPILGVLIPLTVALLVRRRAAWFVSHFATLANGLYLAVGWITKERFLDTTQLIEHGANQALLAAFCLVTIPCEYLGLRRHFIRVTRPDPPAGSRIG